MNGTVINQEGEKTILMESSKYKTMKHHLSILLGILAIVIISGCVSEAPAEPSLPICTPDWQCIDWSDCERTGITTGIQTRVCADASDCNITTNKPSESQTCALPPITSKEPSELALQLTELEGEGWEIAERAERVRSEMSPDALARGWKGGYFVRFRYVDADNPFLYTKLEQRISIYPRENITKILNESRWTPFISEEGGYIYAYTYDELSDPNIGDDGYAFRVTKIGEMSGTESRSYIIEFVKLDVYQFWVIEGTTGVDYELLKNLAKKAADKIV